MTTPSLRPAPIGDDNGIEADAYAAGLADAHDEHQAGTPVHVLETRLDWLTEHLVDVNDAYTSHVLGYAAAVIALRLKPHADTHAAYTSKETAR